MLTRLDLRRPGSGLDDAELRAHLATVPADDSAVGAVRDILEAVRTRGDDALRELTERFDGVRLDAIAVDPDVVRGAPARIDPDVRRALETAARRIRAYHETQLHSPPSYADGGVEIEERVVPVDRAGCYAPGGRAAYPSTVLMTAVPARVAGVGEVVLCVPPAGDGAVPDVTLAAAAIAGVDAVFRIGGAQAVAAMAYGTASVPAVDVIVGPGNRYVALAKRAVTGVVGIDAIAGPSEVVIVADEHASPSLVAADLAAQAEHGPGGAAVLVTWSAALLDDVDRELAAIVAASTRRADMESTLVSGGRAVLVADVDAALRVANWIAPEHLQLMTADADGLVARVRNAGAVFCGPWAPAALGDYVAGVNHVLPTGRAARFSSALRVDTFRKHIHVVRATEAGLGELAPHLVALARAEGLDAHADSVVRRVGAVARVDGER